jgi:2-methylisocitrate lyase-like PEP mutase family enzyme
VSALSDELRRLHRPVLVLPNVWDVGSALLVAGLPGCRALATTSSGVAASLGYPDGERIPAADMLAAVGRIARAVEVPVTADLEAGYGDAAATARAALDAGLAGLNLEDKAGPADEHVERIRAVRAEVGEELVVNARIDLFLHGTGGADEAVERGNAYLAAGADCVFPIGVSDGAVIAHLAAEIDGPVNVLATAATPPVAELEAMGVARVTFGSGLTRAAYGAAVRAAREALEDGTYGWLEAAAPWPDLSRLLEGFATIDAASRGGAAR